MASVEESHLSEEPLDMVEDDLDVKKYTFDIGIAGMFNRNFGNTMTYYALYRALKDEGHTVLMIDCPLDSSFRKQFKEAMFPTFIQVPYESHEICDQYPDRGSMVDLNEVCEKFILGSDQTARPSVIKHHGDYGYLGWVRSDRTKIAYAASFAAEKLLCTDYQKAEMSFFFKRFNAFSVREESGVALTKGELDFESTWVMDPVFLCNIDHYKNLGVRGTERLPKVNYLGAYIRKPQEFKADIITYAAKKLKLTEMNIIPDAYDMGKEWLLPTMNHVKTEEWVANTAYCDFFITDSFHGVCFALMFQKRFVALFENGTDERVKSLLMPLGLENRIVGNIGDLDQRRILFKPINYEDVGKKLKEAVEDSRRWLMDSLSLEIDGTLTEYDLIMEYVLKKKIRT